jgi:hypothetical protein
LPVGLATAFLYRIFQRPGYRRGNAVRREQSATCSPGLARKRAAEQRHRLEERRHDRGLLELQRVQIEGGGATERTPEAMTIEMLAALGARIVRSK